MKNLLNIKGVLLGLSLSAIVPCTAYAIDDSKQHFTLDMYNSIKTVTGNHFNAYDVVINKPLAQIIEIDSYTPNAFKSPKHQTSMFDVAMQLQDRVHYYWTVWEDTMSTNTDADLVGQECETTSFAKVRQFFTF